MSNTSATGGYLTPTSSPPAEDGALDDIFTGLIVGLAGYDPALVRPRWQVTIPKMPDPSVDWCAIGVTEDEPDDNAAITHDPTGNGQDNLIRQETIRVLASFYGPNARGLAKQVRDGLYIPQNWEVLENSLLAFIATDTIRAVPELLNNNWLRRYDMSIRFRRMLHRSYAVENILSAEITINDSTINVSP